MHSAYIVCVNGCQCELLACHKIWNFRTVENSAHFCCFTFTAWVVKTFYCCQDFAQDQPFSGDCCLSETLKIHPHL